MIFLYGGEFARIVGKSNHLFGKPDAAQPPMTKRGCEDAHAIYADKFESWPPNLVLANPSLYYIYRPRVRMARTLFDNT